MNKDRSTKNIDTGERQADIIRNMKKNAYYDEMADDLRPEYDLSQLKGGVRGKYASKYKEGTNLILLEPDVAEIFKDNETVNEALRLLIKIAGAKYKKAVVPAA